MHTSLRRLAASVALTMGLAAQASEAPQELAEMYHEFFEENLVMNPIQATAIGDLRYNDQLPNVLGAEFRDQQREFNERWLKRIRGTAAMSFPARTGSVTTSLSTTASRPWKACSIPAGRFR